MKKLYTIKENKKISGVCMGIAEYTNINVAYIRGLFIVLLLLFGPVAAVYLIIQMITPKKNNIDYSLYTTTTSTYKKDKTNKMLFGVCSGLSNELKIDVSVIRLIFITLSIIDIGSIIYIAAIYVMED